MCMRVEFTCSFRDSVDSIPIISPRNDLIVIVAF